MRSLSASEDDRAAQRTGGELSQTYNERSFEARQY
jgi:hypothetical protein